MEALKDKLHAGRESEETIFLVHRGEKGPQEARLAKNTKKTS